MKWTRLFVFFAMLLLAVGSLYAAELVNYSYFPADDSANFIFVFSTEPTGMATRSQDYGRYFEITLQGNIQDDQEILRFLGYSPVVGFKATSGKDMITLRFDMLLPREPQVEILANSLRVSFPRNTFPIQEFASYTDTALSGDRPTLVSLLTVLRKYLDVNLVIDETSIGNARAEFVMLSENLKAEDFFLQILMNNPTIGYAFLPNRTIYIVRKEELDNKVQQMLQEVSLSPVQTTSFWSSYTFVIQKSSELYMSLSAQEENSQSRTLNTEAFRQLILEEFGNKFAKIGPTLANNLIVLPRGKGAEEDITVGVLLYGEASTHERFEYFMAFFEGINVSGEEGNLEAEPKEYSQTIAFDPLLVEELREFLVFYTKTIRTQLPENERSSYIEGVSFEMKSQPNRVILYGSPDQVQKLRGYLEGYIHDRKARGNEKLESFPVQDGYGKIFALSLSRIFPKALSESQGFSGKELVQTPTFEWDSQLVSDLYSFDGQVDQVTILGSSYEVSTAKRIADDWGLLVPPLESEIRMMVFSNNIPESILDGLKNPLGPNSLAARFPLLQIDFSFDPLVVVKGKPHDIDALQGYVREIESAWVQEFENYEVLPVSDAFFAEQGLVNELQQFIGIRWPSIDLFPFPGLKVVLLKAPASTNMKNAMEEIRRADQEISQIPEVASRLVYFDRLSEQDIQSIWENFYKERGVEKLYFSFLDAYKVYGPQQAVDEMIRELKELDVTRIMGRATEEPVVEELVRIRITTLSLQEVQQLLSTKVPNVVLTPFQDIGFFLKGTVEQIEKAKNFLNTLSTDFMEESSIVSLSSGVAPETVKSVLALYYPEGQIQILDLGNSRLLLKGQKERLENARLVLKSFGLVDTPESLEKPFVKTVAYAAQQPGKIYQYSPADIPTLLSALYPSLQVDHLETSRVFLLIGQKSDVLDAEAYIQQLLSSEEPIITRTVSFSRLYDETARADITPEELVEAIRQLYPTVKVEKVAGINMFQVTGIEADVEPVVAQMRSFMDPAFRVYADGTFDIDVSGQSIIELSKKIADAMEPALHLYIPDQSNETTCDLTMQGLTWEKWCRLIERIYDFNVQQIDGLAEQIFVMLPPGIEHQTGARKQRVLNISHGFEEVSNIIANVYGGTVYWDESNGVLIFSGITDAKMVEIKPLISQIVDPRKMVQLSAMVMEDGFTDQLLSNFSMNLSTSTPTMSLDSQDGFSISSSILGIADFSKILEALTRNLQFSMSYNSSKSDGKTQHISQPFVTTLSGESAYIHVGNTSTYEVISPDSTKTRLLTNETGYELNITPFVRANDTIYLEVDIVVSYPTDPAPSSLFSNDERTSQTKVLLKNGDTLVIGGLKGESMQKSVKKLPFIGDLPFVGKFFRKETDISNETTLNIFLTAKVIELDLPETDIFGMNTGY